MFSVGDVLKFLGGIYFGRNIIEFALLRRQAPTSTHHHCDGKSQWHGVDVACGLQMLIS